MDWANMFVARIAGGVLFVFGIALMVLAIWVVVRQLQIQEALQPYAAAVVAFFVAISSFCILVGYRFLFNRPNQFNSLFSPSGWYVGAACFAILALCLALVAIWKQEYLAAFVSLGFCILGYAFYRAGKAASPVSIESPVFPAGTSLLDKGSFAPTDFRFGIELLNDDKTPMEFVVSALTDGAGLSRDDAIRTMLEIHSKGGALLSMNSEEEADRAARKISTEAAAKQHPFTCRAVKRGS